MVTIILFIVSHAGLSIWWMSKVNTTIGFMQKEIEKLTNTIGYYNNSVMNRADADREHKAIWVRIDEHTKKIMEHEVFIRSGK